MSWEPFQIGSDNHGDMADRRATDAFFKFQDAWKPKIRIHAGDNWDFRPLRMKATEEEKRELMRKDFDAGKKFIEQYKPTHFLRGNHDERLWDLAGENRGIISEYASSLIGEINKTLKSLNCKMLPYDKREGVLQIGKLRVVHGYNCGINAARRAALAYGSVLMGHVHAIQSASIESIDNRVGRAIGCLCQLNMQYSRATLATLVHRHGFAYGVIHSKTGEYQVFQAESINGKWLLPTGIKEL